VQVALASATAGHALPQAPQLFASVPCTSTQVWLGELPQRDMPVVHPVTQLPELHTGAAEEHCVVQAPQCAGVVMSVSQPAFGAALQWA
jgi:hypothetical protein